MDELRRRAQVLLDNPPLPPTPTPTLRRRALRRRTRRTTAAAVVGGLCVTGVALVALDGRGTSRPSRVEVAAPTTVTSAGSHPGVALGEPGTFVSTRHDPTGTNTVVAISDAHTGRMVRTLFSVPAIGGVSVTGTAIGPTGDVWITVNSGPKETGHIAGGGPIAHTCTSTVYRVDPVTGRTSTELRGTDDELVSDAQPSPTGDRIAYIRSGCATSYFDNRLAVKDIGTGAVIEIGSGLPRCHVLAHPRWTADGDHIAVLYAKASTPAYTGPEGTCSESEPTALVVVAAVASSPGIVGALAPTSPGCEVSAATVTKTGFAAVEHCGATLFISGPVRLVRYDANLHVASSAALGRCENGASIGGDEHNDTVIISTYQFCPSDAGLDPVTKVFAAGTGVPRQLLALPGGYTAVDQIAF